MTGRSILTAGAIVAALLALALAGCGNSGSSSGAGAAVGSPGGGTGPAPSDGARTYALNQPISFGGGTFTFTGAETFAEVPKRFEKTESYLPENGQYVVVYYSFQGDAANEKAGVDSAIFRLVDSTGESWLMSTDVSNGPASDLTGTKKLNLPGLQMWSDPDPQSTLVMFDVPKDGGGFSINLVKRAADGASGVVVEATVPLGL